VTGDDNGAVDVSRPADPAPPGRPAETAAVPEPPGGALPPPRRRKSRLVLLAVTGLAALAAIGVLTANAVGSSPAPHSAPQAAKPFSLGELGQSGGHVSLAGLAGQPVILNFFASWCAPCKKETPLLARFYAAHRGQVRIIGIDSNDQTAAAKKFVRAEGVTYPIAVDPFPARTATSYGVLALPQTFFLNARHQIVRHVVGDVTAAELGSWAARVAH
jgi:cytochrome c biogenesis protein CcmG, thiol:disulfide interchange protein DsbE